MSLVFSSQSWLNNKLLLSPEVSTNGKLKNTRNSWPKTAKVKVDFLMTPILNPDTGKMPLQRICGVSISFSKMYIIWYKKLIYQ